LVPAVALALLPGTFAKDKDKDKDHDKTRHRAESSAGWTKARRPAGVIATCRRGKPRRLVATPTAMRTMIMIAIIMWHPIM